MIKELHFQEKNVTGHVLGNKSYDRHLRRLRDIYTSNPWERNQFELRRHDKGVIKCHNRHKQRALAFGKREAK